MSKVRLDVLLVEKGLVETRAKAQGTIMAGLVFVNGQKIDKAGTKFDIDSKVLVKGNPCPYVSRGGLKLEKAIDTFKIKLRDKICLDVGASTGGFSDCMLQNHAAKIYAIDVGYGQLDWQIRQNKKVVVMERTNVRYVKKEDLHELADFAAIDVSFISLKLVLHVVKSLLNNLGEVVALVKPQFEAGKDKVEKNGVVKNLATHKDVVFGLINFCKSIGLQIKGLSYSPIKGPKGNIEYLLYLTKNPNEELLYDEENVIQEIEESHIFLKGDYL